MPTTVAIVYTAVLTRRQRRSQ